MYFDSGTWIIVRVRISRRKYEIARPKFKCSECHDQTLIKGPITWVISAQLTGLRFQLGFLNKSSQKDACDYMKKVSARAASRAEIQKNLMYSHSNFSPG